MTLRRFVGWSLGVFAALVIAGILFVAWRTSHALPEISKAVLDRNYPETLRLLDAGEDVNTPVHLLVAQDVMNGRLGLPRSYRWEASRPSR